MAFKDIAGNRSAWVSDSTTYDATAPTGGSVVIIDDNGFTTDEIELSQDDVMSQWRLR